MHFSIFAKSAIWNENSHYNRFRPLTRIGEEIFHLFSTILHGSARGWLGSALLASSRGAARQCSAVRSSALWSHSLLIAQSYFLSQTKKKNWGKNRLGVVFGAQRKKNRRNSPPINFFRTFLTIIIFIYFMSKSNQLIKFTLKISCLLL